MQTDQLILINFLIDQKNFFVPIAKIQVEWSDMASNDSFLKHLNIWVFGVGSKLVPCVLLTYLSFSLISVLIEADKRKRRLLNRKPPSLKGNKANQAKQADQKMLSTSLSSSTNLQLEVTTTQDQVEMTVLSRALDARQATENSKCLSKPTNQLLKTDHLESSVTLPASSGSDQTTTDQTTGYSNQEASFDCNNNLGSIRERNVGRGDQSSDPASEPNRTENPRADGDPRDQPKGDSVKNPSNQPKDNQIENQPLSMVHDGSIANSKEHLNSLVLDQKRNSASSVSRQSLLVVQKVKKSMPAIDLNSKRLRNDNASKLATPTVVSSTNQTPVQSSSVYIQSSQSDRTTKMLISVLLIFLLCEFPSGILILLSSIIGECLNCLKLLKAAFLSLKLI